MEPKIIEVCEAVNRLGGRAVVGEVVKSLGITSRHASRRLAAAVSLCAMTADRGTAPRIYRLSPKWRDLAVEAGTTKTKTEDACEAVEKLGMATAGQVGKKMGTDSSTAAGRLSPGLRKGWLRLETQGKKNLYSVTSEWYRHVADEAQAAEPAEPEPEIETAAGDLRIEYVGKPRMVGPLVGTHWFGVGKLSGSWSRA